MKSLTFSALLTALLLVGCAHREPVTKAAPAPSATFTTPKLDILDSQIKANPSNSQAYSNRGYTLALLGRKEAARADLRKAVELTPNAAMRNRVGWAYFNLGDYEEAVRQFEQAAEMSQNRSRYDYYSKVLGYWGTGNHAKAMENYQLAVEREPKFGQFATLEERIAEWTPLEQRAMRETYVLWSKTWKPQ
ncbi:MAG: tetratricopeptide repeat protein [Verrucomicrobia bacterium]|jgi:tetratricopeptide (TPR) repeat protein|nr:tetratricopeptide repeat protein [Verrucomicrobiota bacterium]